MRCGVTAKQLRERLASGDWVQIRDDVYCASSRPADELGRILSVALDAGPRIAMSGVAAAYVRRFPGVSAPGELTAAVPLNRRVSIAGCRIERSRCFPGVVPRVNSVPVLSRLDTLITFADQVPHAMLTDCLQELVRQRAISLSDVPTVLRRGRSGSAALHCAIAELADGGDSRPERRLYRALREGAVVGFAFGWELVLPDGTRYQPDLWHDALEFCIEVDGVATHSIASRMDSDRVRHNRLALDLGITVARFTPGRIERATAEVVEEARAAVTRRRVSATPRRYTARKRPPR
jgi:very-short-patch-repair endonuclease